MLIAGGAAPAMQLVGGEEFLVGADALVAERGRIGSAEKGVRPAKPTRD